MQSGGQMVEVTEEVVDATPFCTLVHFAKRHSGSEPRVLVVAPLSGRFATLLRDTVRTILRDHDVSSPTGNARDVGLEHGRFGLDEYIEHVIHFSRRSAPARTMAVCQPCVPVLAATAVMAEDGHPATPRTLILMVARSARG